MRVSLILCGLLVLVALVRSSPIEKRDADDLSPLNEVYLVETEDDASLDDGERGDRDKRKIGVIKLGVTNGIINFVFGKLDSFLDSKTRALAALDEANKVKNAAFGIDASQSATGQFISGLVSSKIQAASGSIGPVVNSAATLLQGATSGLTSAFVSKLAPLSSLSGGLGGLGGLSGGNAGASTGAGASVGVSAGTSGSGAGILGSLIANKVGSLSSLSQGIGGPGALSGGAGSAPTGAGSTGPAAGAGINLGAFANLGGGGTVATTTEDIPEFDRTKVSLDIPPAAFGSGFTLVTNVSKILSSVILNSARRTQTFLELFKPLFRGVFAIKGLPSDNL